MVVHLYAFQHCPTTGMRNDPGRGMLSISPTSQVVKIFNRLEPHGIFGPNVAYLFTFT